MDDFSKRVTIIGGCGHIGLPLGIVLAEKGHDVTLYDIDIDAIALVNSAQMPFKEVGAESILKKVTSEQRLRASNDKQSIKASDVVIITLDTPLDNHLNPDVHKFINIFKDLESELHEGQLIIFRSTLYPGATEWLHEYLKDRGKVLDIAFCPERIAEGHAIRELQELPQIVSGCTTESISKASDFFRTISPKIIVTTLLEAELSKLMTNTWRYISFAVANQFYMIAEENNINFHKIHSVMTEDYPRMKSFPKAGFAAGPCLVKDTMQLLSYANNQFLLGESARQINEGLPRFVINQIKKKYPVKEMSIGVLGMAFKANSDDPRQSLSYRLMKILEIKAKKVLCNDPYIEDERFVSVERVLNEADLIIIATAHEEYKNLIFDKNIIVYDIWNIYGKE